MNDFSMEKMLEMIEFDESGLVPAVVQDIETKRVLMLAYMNERSFRRTIKEKKACFYSRSRQELWLKGETSGNYQHVREISIDCDGDTLLLLVEPAGPACHTEEVSCFYRSLKKIDGEDLSNNDSDYCEADQELDEEILDRLATLIKNRNKNRPEDSYTTELFQAGIKDIAQKIGEEGVELSLAALSENEQEIYEESADLIYHLLVMLEARGLSFQEVLAELSRRYHN